MKSLLNKVKPSPQIIARLPDQEGAELLTHLEALEHEQKTNKIFSLYSNSGPLRRELYPKHMAFFKAGIKYRERAAIAANRVGKTFGIGGYETTLHLIGKYPDWWEGRRFNRPVDVWCAGDTSETTRDILQVIFMGNAGEMGTGLIPQSCILGSPTHRAGVAGAIDTVKIKHGSGGTSSFGFKCFPKGTRISMADGSVEPIEDIHLGQMVSCADGSAGQVIETHSYADASLLKIVTKSGEISATRNHRMFTRIGELEAGELRVGDELEVAFPEHGQKYEIVTEITGIGTDNVYCVAIKDRHELIANGYRVGNSYDQGRKKFQGTARDVIFLDEEPPIDVYTECLTRLMTRDGSMICTFTPLEGLSEVVLMYLPELAPTIAGISGDDEDDF